MAYSNIITGGNPIADFTVSYDDEPELRRIIAENPWKAGDKRPIGKYSSLFNKYEHLPCTPGGSTSNVVANLQALERARDKELDISYIGVAGRDEAGKMLEKAYKEDGAYLFPGLQDGVLTARSLIINDVPKGKNAFDRMVLLDSGNAATALEHQLPGLRCQIWEHVRDSDVVLVAGSMLEKMPDTHVVEQGFAGPFDLGVGDGLVDSRFKFNKELWFALPTTLSHGEKEAERIRFIIGSANVILGNDDELRAIFGGSNKDEALAHLQNHLKEHGLHARHTWNPTQSPSAHSYRGPTDQVALITCGEGGADIVTKESIIHVPGKELITGRHYMLGAGDAAFSGFLFGWMHRDELGYAHDPERALRLCGDMSMALAVATISVPQARYGKPADALKEVAPELFAPRESGHAGELMESTGFAIAQ